MHQHKLKSIIIELIGPYKKRACIALVLVFLTSLTESIGYGLIMPLLEIVINGETNSYFGSKISSITAIFESYSIITVCIILIMGIFLFKNILIIFRNNYIYSTEWKFRAWWMHKLFDYFLAIDYIKLSRIKQGDIVNNITTVTLNSASGIRQMIELFSQITLVCALLTVLLISNYIITIILIIVSSVLMIFTRAIVKNYTMHVGQNRILYDQGIYRSIVETISGMQTVRALVLEKVFSKRFLKNLNPLVSMMSKSEVIKRIPTQTFEMLFVILLLSMLVFIEKTMGNELVDSLPFLGMFVVVSTRLFSNLGSLSANIMAIKIHLPSIHLISSLINETNEISYKNTGIVFQRFTKGIRISQLSFGYDKENRILDSVNLDIPKGSMVGLIGPSGSGKSTLANLLLGLYAPVEGNIYIDEVRLSDLNIDSWRRSIGYVSQDSFFFNGTVYENLILSNPNRSMKNIEEALKKAHCEDFINTSNDGLNIPIGDRGLTLSGGQRTRLSLARAILSEPQIYILDEVSSALDPDSEQAIIRTLEELRDKATIFIITHRFSLINNADVIYKLNNAGSVRKVNTAERATMLL